MRTKPMQLSVIAVAALAIVAVAALMLLAGGNPAQAQDDTGGIGPGGVGPGALPQTGKNEDHYSTPVPCSEEADPDDAKSVVDEGYYPVFEGFWDYEVGHLSNNFCPPKVTEKPGRTGTVYTRTDDKTHISQTAFSIPDSYKVTVVDSDQTNGNPSTAADPKIDLANYPFLRDAVSAVKPGPDSTAENPTTVFANNSVWWVREGSNLKMGLSTALMRDADWYRKDGPDPDTDPDPPVQFQFAAVHVLEAGVPVETHVVGANFFAFDFGASQDEPLWSSANTDFNEVNMHTETYRPMQFVVTKPGVYLVQANVQGHVRNSRDPAPENPPDRWMQLTPDKVITSPTEWYTLHVGPEADVEVTITHTDETPDDDTTTVTDGTASFSVTAQNNGPSTSDRVVVQVSLPVGLEYVAPEGQTGVTYECGVIAWTVGNLNKGQSQTLGFTANVQTGGPKSLTVEAEVHSSTVDDNKANNTAAVEVLTNSTVVRAPLFGGATRAIVEHAIAGTHAGDPVEANNPDGRALGYSLSGRCSGWFQAHSNGQIVLASGRTLDVDEQSEFHLTLHVSDGVNATGATDASADDSAPVTIKVIDTEDEEMHPTLSVTHTPENPTTDQVTTLTATVADLSGSITSCSWRQEGQYYSTPGHISGLVCSVHASSHTAEELTYSVHIKWLGGGISGSTTVNWSNPE